MSAFIREMDACDLIGRLVTNENGAEFVVTRLSFDASNADVVIWVRELHPDGPHAHESGLQSLHGWEIHQPLTKADLERD